MSVLVVTETSAYLIDHEAMTATRLPGWGAGPDPAAWTPARLDALRRDGEAIPMYAIPNLVIGQPMVLLLQIREDGVPTRRQTTNVRNIRT